MASDDMQEHDSLSSSTVAQLREICKDRGLMVSGKKADLIDRILEDSGVSVIRGEGEKRQKMVLVGRKMLFFSTMRAKPEQKSTMPYPKSREKLLRLNWSRLNWSKKNLRSPMTTNPLW